jgi:hypothetical protein
MLCRNVYETWRHVGSVTAARSQIDCLWPTCGVPGSALMATTETRRTSGLGVSLNQYHHRGRNYCSANGALFCNKRINEDSFPNPLNGSWIHSGRTAAQLNSGWYGLPDVGHELRSYFVRVWLSSLDLREERSLQVLALKCPQNTYSKPLLIRSQLIWMSDNPDRNIKKWKILFTVEYILNTRDLGARGLSDSVEGSWRDWNHARKHRRLTWAVCTPWIAASDRKKLVQWYFLYIFISTTYILDFPFICFLSFFVF